MMRTYRCSLLLLAVQNVVAFVPPAVLPSRATHHAPRTSTFQHNIIFTRLAEDCMSALHIAQEQASLLGQDEVDNSYMLLGICKSPGRAASTLEKYNIRTENVLPVLNEFGLSTSRPSVPKLSDFSETKAKQALPYSKSLQKTLNGAGEIAEVMGSPAIHSEHVFLALMDYNENAGPYEAHAATRGDDCEAMEIIWHLDAQLEGEDICHALLQAMMDEKADEGTTAATPEERNNGEMGGINALVTASGGISGDSKQKSMLKECSVDLTKQARDGDLDPVHGRDDEIQSCLRILLRRRKNNVCLIGEAGVGKTSIAEGLAQILVSKDCPGLLKGYRILSLEVAALLAGTKYRGEFEARLRTIIEELTDELARPTILFLDEIHTIVGAGGTDGGSMDAANLLKPYLARGQIQLIGATTITEYNKFIAKDAALERRLQPVLIKEPTVDQTIEILRAILPSYQTHHRVEFTDASLVAAAKLSDRFINERFLPDKAIDLMDEAGALAALTRIPDGPPPEVDENLITQIISEWSSIPVGKLELDEMDRLRALEENLASRVKGQARAVRSVAKAIRRARTGVRNPQRPIASFLFCGVSGTGKTHLCKTLADTYYGSERNLVRLDMSEYMEKFTVSRLTGPPPGFTGYEEGGQLTEAIRRAPHSVVLLDELEKAHGDVLNILLQVMEDGILTDGQGRTVSFKNTILIMTSNIGSQRILDLVNACQGEEVDLEDLEVQPDSCRVDGRPAYPELVGAVKSELGKTMKPEFLNRIDEIVVFEHLSETELAQIATTMIIDITIRVKMERNVDIEVSGELLRKIVQEGSKSALQYGARPMRRAVQRIYENAISDAVVQGFIKDGDSATFGIEGDADKPYLPWYVMVTRDRDDEVLRLEIEDSSRDNEDEPTVPTDSDEASEESPEPEPEPQDMEAAFP